MFYTPVVGILLDLQLCCTSGQRCTDSNLWVRGKGHFETTCGQISTVGCIFSPLSGVNGHILMKFITVSHYQVHMIWLHFQGHGFKGQGHRHMDNICLNVHFSSRGVPINGLPSKIV